MALSQDGLDQTVKDEIGRLVQKPAEEFTDEEKSFLRARSGYLSKHDTERYAEILTPQKGEEKKPAPSNKSAKNQPQTPPTPQDSKENPEDDGEDEAEG